MSSEFFCKICDITCNGKAPFEQHLQSAKHIKKAQGYQSSSSSEQSTSPTVSSASPKFIAHSLSSTANTTNISEDSSASISISPETMRILLEWNHPRGYKPYCDICQLPLHGDGDNNADIHFRSNNNIHNQKLATWKKIQEGDAPYSCKVCSEIFTNETMMRDHFISDIHGNMVQQKSNLKKFIKIYETYDKLKQARIERKNSEIKTIIDDNLSNEFEKLKVIDGTEQKIKPKKAGIFSENKFHEIMKNNVTKDDDDD